MNSKKKLASLGFTILAICFSLSAKAQPQIQYNNNTFLISTPATQQPFVTNSYTNVFFETGTGEFFIFSTKTFRQSNQQYTFNLPWYSNTTNVIRPVVQLATFYDTIIKPHSTSNIISQPTWGTNSLIQNRLTGNNITLTNCINNTIIPGDTMTLALTYKNAPSPVFKNAPCSTCNKSVIAFFYNSKGNTSLFDIIPTANGITYSFNGMPVKPVRQHNQETITELTSLPGAIQNLVNSNFNNGDFTKILILAAPFQANSAEKNIFLSLVPTTNTFLSDAQVASGGKVKAVLIDYDTLNANSCYNVTKDSTAFSINRYSRDPNYITATPSCLDSLSKNINIDYKIHFENIGPGTENKVKITVFIPEGLQFPLTGEKRFTCKIGNDTVIVFKEGTQFSIKDKVKRHCLYGLDLVNRTITFTISDANLLGTGGTKDNNLQLRSGDISFKVQTDFSIYKACMYSAISIAFGQGNQENLPVTDYCLIRRNCSKTKDCPFTFTFDPKHKGD